MSDEAVNQGKIEGELSDDQLGGVEGGFGLPPIPPPPSPISERATLVIDLANKAVDAVSKDNETTKAFRKIDSRAGR